MYTDCADVFIFTDGADVFIFTDGADVFIFTDGARLNVLLLLSVVCSATMMKMRRYEDGCEVVREVCRKVQQKTVKLLVSGP